MESKKNKMAPNITWREKLADLALFGGLIWTLFLTLWAHDADAQNHGVFVWVWLLVLCFFVCIIFPNKSGSVHNASCRLSQFFDCAKISVALIFFLGSILCVHLRIPVLAICIPVLLYSIFLIVFLEVLSLVFKVKVRTNEKNKHKEPACTKELVTKPHKRLAYAMRGISLPICDCGYWEEKARAKQAKKRNKGG